MWQFIFFYLSNHHHVYSASGIVLYRIPPWSIVSDLSLAGFLNTLLEVFSHRTALYTNHLPVSPSWGFPEKEQWLCNGFLKHQQSPLDTARISLFPSLWTKLQLRLQLIAARSSHHGHSSSPYDFHQQLPTFNAQIVHYRRRSQFWGFVGWNPECGKFPCAKQLVWNWHILFFLPLQNLHLSVVIEI